MSLSALRIPSVEIKVGDGGFAVTGLSADAVSFLVRSHQDDVHAVFSAAMSGSLNLDTVIPVIERFPKLVAAIIATAAGEPQMADKAADLPVSTQIEALEAIGTLTFGEGEQGVGKFVETVARTIGSLTTLGQGLKR